MCRPLASLIYERPVGCLGVGVRGVASSVYFTVNQVTQARSVWIVGVYTCVCV